MSCSAKNPEISCATERTYSLRIIVVGNNTKTSATRKEKEKKLLKSVRTMVSTLSISVNSIILLNKINYKCSDP